MEYDPETGDKICDFLAQGYSLKSICEHDDMPGLTTVFKWLRTSPEFANSYAQAREAQADTLADEIQDIVDDGRNDWVERMDERTGRTRIVLNEEAIARSRLRMDARKWIASKLKPKKYGERVEVEHAGSVKHVTQLTDEELERIAAMGKKDE